MVPVSKGCAVRVADRKHRVVLCSQKSDIDENGNLLVERRGMITGWAAIDIVKPSRFSNGGNVVSKAEQPTHRITMNFNPDVNVSVSAWIYEHRLKSPPRWFKVLSVANVGESSRFMQMTVRLTEVTDEAEAPVEENANTGFGATSLPEGLSL